MTALEAETTSNEAAQTQQFPCSDYGRAVARFLDNGSEQDCKEASHLACEIASQKTPLRKAFETLWCSARPSWPARDGSGRLDSLDSFFDLQQDLCEAFERVSRLERSSHDRLASAYSYKIREVNALLDSLPAFVVTKDSHFHYLSANRLFCDAVGEKSEDIIAKTDSHLFGEAAAERLLEQDRQVINSGSPVRSELSLDFKGSGRTVLFVKAPVLDSNGEVGGLIGVGFDITERKRMEREHLLLAAAVESAGEAIFVTDTNGTIQYANPAFARTTGYSQEEAIGQDSQILRSNSEDEDFFTRMWDSLRREKVWRGTLTLKSKDGALIDVDQTIAPVHGSNGRITSYVAVMRDITERNRMVESLRRAVMVKTDFTSMVSHELRTPLTAIKEAIDIVEDQTAGRVNKQQADFLALAKRNIDRLHRLINDTLDFSKLERGALRLQLDLHDLNEVVREIVTQQELAAKKHGLRLDLSAADDLGMVRMDPDRISQVLVNLIGNAIRYCQRGWIRVSTRRAQDEAVVKIQDSGPGIPPEELGRIFEAFVQLSTGPGRKVGGTGLGLAICKQIVELHGGRIWVESKVGQGSEFCFALHLKEPEP